MLLGAPTEEAPPRSVARVEMKDCALTEPMVLGLVRNIGTAQQSRGAVELPNWVDACRAAYKALCRLYPKNAEGDAYYQKGLVDGSFMPKVPYWSMADANNLVFIWPKRYHEDYLRRLKEGSAAPIPGYDDLTK